MPDGQLAQAGLGTLALPPADHWVPPEDPHTVQFGPP